MLVKWRIRHIVLALVVGLIGLWAFSKPAFAELANGITKPGEGSSISGAITVAGVADDPNFVAWQLDLLPSNSRDIIFVGRGSNRNPAPGALGRLDTSLYPNGDYQLRLRVIRNDGNYTEYWTNFSIDNGARGQNGITYPWEGSTVSCLMTIKGVAYGATFLKRQVDLLVGGAENKVISVGQGSEPRYSEGTFAEFDTTQIPDGNHTLRLRVVREDGNYDTFYTRITVNNKLMAAALGQKTCGCSVPSPDGLPTEPNGITNPPAGSTIKGLVSLCGNAYDINLSTWEVALLPGGDEDQAVLLALGESAILARSPFTLIDTSALPDGKYALRLRVGRTDDTFDEYLTPVCVRNHPTTSVAPPCP